MEKRKINLVVGFKKENDTFVLRSKNVILPKPVVNIEYFTLATNVHALGLLELDILGQQQKLTIDVSNGKYIDKEKEYEKLVEEYETKLELIKTKLFVLENKMMDFSGLNIVILNDNFARSFSCFHTGIKSYYTQAQKTINNEIVYYAQKTPVLILTGNTELKKITTTLCSDKMTKEEKEIVYKGIRSALYKQFVTNDEEHGFYKKVYNNISFNKVGENLIENEYKTRCKKSFKSGKDGEVVSDFQNNPVLVFNLICIGLMSFKCIKEEEKENYANIIDAINYDFSELLSQKEEEEKAD